MTARHAVDGMQQRIAGYANALSYADLTVADVQAAEKFRGLTEEFLGAARANAMLERLWMLESLRDVAPVPAGFNRN